MPLLLLVLFVVVPIAELFVIIQVGQWLGVWPTIGLLVLDSVLGTVLMRVQGRATWRRFREATQAGRIPAREVIDGALVILGGAFLLAPGFLTDLLGFALLLPPTRALLRGVLVKAFAGRMLGPTGAMAGTAARGPSGSGRPTAPGSGPGRGREGDAVDSTAREVPRTREVR